MIATKEQERKALAKIRKIVEELGEDSYVATAFEGCFEIAESNIENDFADSVRDIIACRVNEINVKDAQYKEVFKQYKAAVEENNALKADLKKYNAENVYLKEQNQRWENEYRDLEEREKQDIALIDGLKARTMNRPTADDLYDLLQLARTKVYDEKEEAEKAAKEIVENAENPDCDAFKEAVGIHRWHNGEAEYWQAIVNRVEEDRKRMREE